MTPSETLVLSLLSKLPVPENYSVKTLPEPGSNCRKSVVLINKKGQVLDCRASELDGIVFGGGRQRYAVGRVWDAIKKGYDLPEDFSWETATLVVAAHIWSPFMLKSPYGLMSAWSYLMADPYDALGRLLEDTERSS